MSDDRRRRLRELEARNRRLVEITAELPPGDRIAVAIRDGDGRIVVATTSGAAYRAAPAGRVELERAPVVDLPVWEVAAVAQPMGENPRVRGAT